MIGTFKLPQTETYTDRVAHRFILRVITDGGITYDESNLKAILTNLNNQSLLSSAILVLAPSSYKAGKVYSVFPTDGSGDGTFERDGIATYIDENGIIQTAEANEPRFQDDALLLESQSTNLFTYSEDFSAWIKTGTILISSNSVISPDGTLNGTTISGLTGSGSNDLTFKSVVDPSNKTYTCSFYLKGSGRVRMQISNNVDSAREKFIYLTSVWTRYDLTYTFNSTPGNLIVTIDDTLATTANFDVWGAQLEQGSTATSYIPTNGSTVTRLADVLELPIPIGTTEIIETIDGVEQTPITPVGSTHTVSEGLIDKIVMK